MKTIPQTLFGPGFTCKVSTVCGGVAISGREVASQCSTCTTILRDSPRHGQAGSWLSSIRFRVNSRAVPVTRNGDNICPVTGCNKRTTCWKAIFHMPTDLKDPPTETQTEAPKYVVRYGAMRQLGEFSSKRQHKISRGDDVVVRSDRGVEFGVVLCDANDKTNEYLGENVPTGRILRSASDEDRRSLEEVAEREKTFFTSGQKMIDDRNLQMQLVDVEQVFGGERIVFYYLAEKRVDFRELVKLMAREFNTRIEMRQIGVRDEAKLLADYGDCGKPVCCNTHLKEMPPVSMKMAKLQKATLDPNKISGRCGRLKCCLRYEYDTYEAHRKELPKIGATVITRAGQGKVIAQELLVKKLLVSFEDGRRVMVDESEIVTVVSRGNRGSNDISTAEPDQNTE
jgi:cell fate regulator YaaT (PSP1 superfamily)